jgi:UPF0755 protein
MKKPQLIVVAVTVLAVWLAALFLMPAYPPQGTVVEVPMGAGAGTVGRNLAKAGAVRSAFAFKMAARLTGQSGAIKAGDYEVTPGLTVFQTLDLLVSGKSLMHKFLVREGLSAAQIGAALEKEGLGSAAAFMAFVKDPSQPALLKVPGPTLEGYLFPDSYFLARGMSEAAIAQMMVLRFHAKVPADLLRQGQAIRLDARQVVTMASVIEKEAKADKERPIVSAVFRNRMKQKKRLESCATVRFALNKHTGPLYNKDLLAKSPYNTYQNFGLPPGPICSPGLASIQAALHPAQTDALFFVVAGDGTHIFSKTYEEHQAAVARWKKLKKGIAED